MKLFLIAFGSFEFFTFNQINNFVNSADIFTLQSITFSSNIFSKKASGINLGI